ncbi:ABC transporter [Cryptococcus neoformans c45]|nr:ABC transporter [Cryptococcus neoformans var. grubii c45]
MSAVAIDPSYVEAGKCLDITGLYNDSVSSFHWRGITATMPASGSKAEKTLLAAVSGEAHAGERIPDDTMLTAGELVAIMGPSGSGKTTLLNRLAHRVMPPKAKLAGDIFINDVHATISDIRRTSCYVEQQDHHIGSITTAETLAFAAKFGLDEPIGKAELRQRVDMLLSSFGLKDQKNMIIGTPIQKGLSGGQKRRVSVASQLITSPKILFLDEPTSGLDSVASFEIVSYLKTVARKYKLLVIASIHQPSTKTFNVFDQIFLLAKGRLCYGGPRSELSTYFASIGLEMPAQTNPAEWILEIVDTDFAKDQVEGLQRLERITNAWASDQKLSDVIPAKGLAHSTRSRRTSFMLPFHLFHRNFIKSYRDLIAYWIRVGMYTCLAILMGTSWLRLGYSQDDINARITAIFFSGAFLSFMAVAYIPAYIEDQETFFKERANGLYGPLSFLVANFLIGIPYLFIIVISFSVISYWMVGLWPTATGFWTFVGFLFLDLLAAESLVVFVASLVPNFIVALALVAFANGLWMVTNGFLIPETILNVFWRSWVTKIDYQNWAFRAMMWNEFHQQTFNCGRLSCSFPSLDGRHISGTLVLEYYGYTGGQLGAYAGYVIAIVMGYRLLAWLTLTLRK